MLRISGRDIRYDKMLIGTLQPNAPTAAISFVLTFTAARPLQEQLTGSPSMNTIDGSGTIPLAISYYPLHFRMAEQEPVSASFRSDNLSAQFLEYLLPFLESAEGVIPTTLKIEGRTPKPDIYLTARLHNTKITIEPTQVSYLLNGEVYVTPKAIELRDRSPSATETTETA